jgi:methylmalonyl-CoA/ethylmalonyl-CoA epimerase
MRRVDQLLRRGPWSLGHPPPGAICRARRPRGDRHDRTLNHVAIAVPDLEAAAAQYRDTLGAKVGPPQDEPDHGVTVIFIELPNTKIELLYPLGEDSPIAGFLEKNPSGGIHTSATRSRTSSPRATTSRPRRAGAGHGEPKIGAHGKPVLFLHPKDFTGTLVELEQV